MTQSLLERKEKDRLATKRWQLAHPDSLKAANKRYREKHRAQANEKSRIWRLEHPMQRRKMHDKWYKTHRNSVIEKSMAWVKNNRDKAQINQRHHRYGLSQEVYDQILKNQLGRCAICQEGFKKTPHVDHDHKTDKVRGLLCRRCNTGIGQLGDNLQVLRQATAYLEAHA